MTWIHPLAPEVTETVDVLGAKAHGLIVLRRLGLPVPPGFVIGTPACRAFLRDKRFPDGLDAELAAAVRELGDRTVSVRSGGSVSMPGMMNTILDVRLPDLKPAVEAVFESWHTPRARTYRELHGIPHDLGTAVTVQAMVFGDRDDHSGAGVAFSHDPNTGEPTPFGEVLFGHQGEDVVSGRSVTRPLRELASEPVVWHDLTDALRRLEKHYRDACSVEFTFESGRLWLLQVRAGGLTGRAAVRVAVDLADEGVLSRREAVLRVPPPLRDIAPRMDIAGRDVFTRGLGACPGVASGRVVTTADAAVCMAGPVILVRPHTSPLDLHGMAVATGIVTATGGPTSHAAVVARSMGKPAVVAAVDLTVDASAVRAGGRTLPEGTLVTIDGTGGEVVVGYAPTVPATADPHLRRLLDWAATQARE